MEDRYSIFDMYVATLAVENNFYFHVQNNMKEVTDKTTGKNKHNTDNLEIYMAVSNDDSVEELEQKLKKLNYKFLKT